MCLLLSIGISYAQTEGSKELTKKELKQLKKKLKQEAEAAKYNDFHVDVNAPSIARAIRWYLGSAQIKGGNVILRSNDSMGTRSPYAAWDVDGAVREYPPTGIDLNTIRDVKVLRSLSETNRYGFLGASGVIVIKTTQTIN